MRKKEKQIRDPAEIDGLLASAKIARLGTCLEGTPYIVPMHCGYDPIEKCVYFHTGINGKKIDHIRANPRVCVEIETDFLIHSSEFACRFTTSYQSVIATGTASLIDDISEKQRAFDIIMHQLTDTNGWDYKPEILGMVSIIRVDLEEITGRISLPPRTR